MPVNSPCDGVFVLCALRANTNSHRVHVAAGSIIDVFDRRMALSSAHARVNNELNVVRLVLFSGYFLKCACNVGGN